MKKDILFLLALLGCTFTSWALPLNLGNVQECKKMVENFTSDRNTGYQMNIIHLSGGGLMNDSNEIRFEIDDEGNAFISIQYVQFMYFQLIQITIKKQKERDITSNYVYFMELNNGSSQDYGLYIERGHNFMVKQIMDNLFKSLGY